MRASSAHTSWAGRASTLAALLLPAVAGLFTLRRFNDFDIFWHVRTGQWILSHGRAPVVDPFGSVTANRPWMEVSWAADVAMALIVKATGFLGLQLVAVLIVAATLAACLLRFPRSPLVIWGAMLVVLTCWSRFLVRPDLLSLPLVILLFILADGLEGPRRRSLIWMAGLMVVWCNVHGSFVLAPLVLGARLAGGLFRRRLDRRVALALGLSLAAPLATPYGFRLYALLAPYMKSLLALAGAAHTRRLTLIEWHPTWQSFFSDPSFPRWSFLGLTAVLGASFVGAGKRLSTRRLLPAAGMFLLSLTALRHLLVFGAASLAVIALNERDRLAAAGKGKDRDGGAGRRPARRERSPRASWLEILPPAAAAVVLIWVGAAVLDDGYYVARDLASRTGVGVDPRVAPEGAARWLAGHAAPGLIFNNFDSGAYLHHRLFPEFRPYLDARLVDPDLYFRVSDAVADTEQFEKLVRRDGIRTIVLLHPSPETFVLLPRLAADTGWRLVYRNRNSTVHVRSGEAPAPARHPPISLPPMLTPSMQRINRWLDQVKTHVLPAGELTDALVSHMLGQKRREQAAYERARRIAPDNPRVEAHFAPARTPGAGPGVK
ncbi:MAG: hypothetical protein ACE5HD_00590 [Acidobacteriota bacterium]